MLTESAPKVPSASDLAEALRTLRDCINETRGKDAHAAVEHADTLLAAYKLGAQGTDLPGRLLPAPHSLEGARLAYWGAYPRGNGDDAEMWVSGFKYARAVLPGHSSPAAVDGWVSKLTALRSEGWAVAVHNDYRLDGKMHTFWLFTKGDRAVKGEGRTDDEALTAAMLAAAKVVP